MSIRDSQNRTFLPETFLLMDVSRLMIASISPPHRFLSHSDALRSALSMASQQPDTRPLRDESKKKSPLTYCFSKFTIWHKNLKNYIRVTAYVLLGPWEFSSLCFCSWINTIWKARCAWLHNEVGKSQHSAGALGVWWTLLLDILKVSIKGTSGGQVHYLYVRSHHFLSLKDLTTLFLKSTSPEDRCGCNCLNAGENHFLTKWGPLKGNISLILIIIKKV